MGNGSAGVIMELTFLLQNGSSVVVATGADWLGFDATLYFGPYKSTANDYTQPREFIDARLQQYQWSTSKFVPPPAVWHSAVVHSNAFLGVPLLPKSTDTIRITNHVKPVIEVVAQNSYFIDFTTEMMGGVTLQVVVAKSSVGHPSCRVILGEGCVCVCIVHV